MSSRKRRGLRCQGSAYPVSRTSTCPLVQQQACQPFSDAARRSDPTREPPKRFDHLRVSWPTEWSCGRTRRHPRINSGSRLPRRGVGGAQAYAQGTGRADGHVVVQELEASNERGNGAADGIQVSPDGRGVLRSGRIQQLWPTLGTRVRVPPVAITNAECIRETWLRDRLEVTALVLASFWSGVVQSPAMRSAPPVVRIRASLPTAMIRNP